MKRFLLIFMLLVPVITWSQNTDDDSQVVLNDLEDDGEAPKKGYRHQFNIEVSAPHYFYNAANMQAFNGIINVSMWYNVKIAGNFYMGPYVRYTGFEYYAGRVNQSNPLVTHISGGLNFAYEVKMGDRFTYFPSLFLGAGYVQYNNLVLPPKGVNDTQRNTWTDWGFTAQTNQSFYYYIKQNRKMAVGLILGLNVNSHQFSLKETGLNGDASINSFSDKGPTISGNVGFGLLMNFGKIRH